MALQPKGSRSDTARATTKWNACSLAAERERIDELFRAGKLNDEARRRIERELDMREARFPKS